MLDFQQQAETRDPTSSPKFPFLLWPLLAVVTCRGYRGRSCKPEGYLRFRSSASEPSGGGPVDRRISSGCITFTVFGKSVDTGSSRNWTMLLRDRRGELLSARAHRFFYGKYKILIGWTSLRFATRMKRVSFFLFSFFLDFKFQRCFIIL